MPLERSSLDAYASDQGADAPDFSIRAGGNDERSSGSGDNARAQVHHVVALRKR